MEIAASARKHGVSDDMRHAATHFWRSFAADDPQLTVLIGPFMTSAPLEVIVASDGDDVAIIHAMPARRKYLTGWWIR